MSAACPECGGSLTDTEGFVPWCLASDYNVDPIADSISSQNTARSDAEFDATVLPMAPTAVRMRRGVVYAVAGLVHAVTIGILLAGVYLLVRWFPAPLSWIGSFLIVLAILMRPRLGRLPKDIDEVDLDQTPALAQLLDEIAGRLDTKRPDRVYLTPEFNMSFGHIGLRRLGVLKIGVPLWLSLEPAQRIAVLGHELGHAVNQDSRRGIYVGGAIDALATWHDVLHPGPWPQGASVSEYLGYILLGPPRMLVAWMTSRARGVLLRLTQERQRAAEFFADRLAVAVAGREATMNALGSLEIGDSVLNAMNAARRRRDDEFDALAALLETMPAHEWERLRRRSKRRGTAVDDSHPPTSDRIEAIRHWTPDNPTVPIVYDSKVDHELSPLLSAQQERVSDYLTTLTR